MDGYQASYSELAYILSTTDPADSLLSQEALGLTRVSSQRIHDGHESLTRRGQTHPRAGVAGKAAGLGGMLTSCQQWLDVRVEESGSEHTCLWASGPWGHLRALGEGEAYQFQAGSTDTMGELLSEITHLLDTQPGKKVSVRVRTAGTVEQVAVFTSGPGMWSIHPVMVDTPTPSTPLPIGQAAAWLTAWLQLDSAQQVHAPLTWDEELEEASTAALDISIAVEEGTGGPRGEDLNDDGTPRPAWATRRAAPAPLREQWDTGLPTAKPLPTHTASADDDVWGRVKDTALAHKAWIAGGGVALILVAWRLLG